MTRHRPWYDVGCRAELRLRRLGAVAVAACGTCFCPVAPAVAARANSFAATRTYLRASETYERTREADVGASITAIEFRDRQVAGECPSALTYAPRDTAFVEFSEEIAMSDWYAAAGPLHASMLRMAGVIDRVRWSDRRLTRLAHSEAAEELGIVRLDSPDVCAQIEAWRASSYATLPSSVNDFLQHARMIESESTIGSSGEPREKAIMRLLRRYEGPAEQRIAERVRRLEARADRRVAAGAILARRRLAVVLGVSEL